MSTNPSSRACLFCRSKHLKCDAKHPACTRCTVGGVDCVYVQSRRGYVGPRRKQPGQLPQAGEHIATNLLAAQTLNDGLSLTDQASSIGPYQTPSSDTTITIPSRAASTATEDQLIDAYYTYVHPAHPFVIPYKLFKQDPDALPEHLKRAMRLIASHVPARCEETVGNVLDIFNTNVPVNGFKVQTCLLLTITSYARCEREQGDMALLQAINTANRIGMHLEDFGYSESPLVRESWRRTWWELYSIASLIRVLTPCTSRLDAAYDGVLPSFDNDYNDCRPTESRTLEDMQDRFFSLNVTTYSSFAYRIEAARILNEVLEATQKDQNTVPIDSTFNSLSASIRSYLLSLPNSNRNALADGRPDEMLSCALMTINLASILLNLPRSDLGDIQSFQTICATDRPKIYSAGEESHMGAAMRAADAITQLFIDRDVQSMKTLSPCFSCAIAFAVTVQLSAYCLGQKPDRARCLKEYIQLSLSTLDNIGQSWPVARAVKSQLADYASEILRRPKTTHHQTARFEEEAHSVTQPLPLEDVPVPAAALDFEDEIWLRSFVNDPLDYSFAVNCQGG